MVMPEEMGLPPAPNPDTVGDSPDKQNLSSSALARISGGIRRVVCTALLDLKIRVIYGNQGDVSASIERDRAARLSYFEQDKSNLLCSLREAEDNIRKWERENHKQEQNATMDDLEGDLGDLLIDRDDVRRKLRRLDGRIKDLEENTSRMLNRVHARTVPNSPP